MSQEVEKRHRSHINQLRLGTHNNFYLQKDYNEFGESSFKFKILYEFDDKLECQSKEIELINTHSNLYNIVKDSSVGGDIFTHNPRKEELRELRHKQMSGKSNHQYGKAKTEKMINSVKEANSKKVIINEILYDSGTIARKVLDIPHSTLSYRLKSSNYPDWNYA